MEHLDAGHAVELRERARRDQVVDRGYRQRIIPIGRIDSLITAKERLDRGELVGILGDRDPWRESMPKPQRLSKPLIEEGHQITPGRVQAMHEGKRRARERGG